MTMIKSLAITHPKMQTKIFKMDKIKIKMDG